MLAASDAGVSGAGGDGIDSSSATLESDGGNVLTGTVAFPVNFAFIDTSIPKEDCNDTTSLPGGGYASFALFLSDVDPFGDTGAPLNTLPPGAHLLRIELAGPSYTGAFGSADGGAAAPVTPGTYTVGFDGEDDDDLCMLPPGTSAILDVFDFSGDGSFTQTTAASGTITLTTVMTGDIQGSFQVALSQSPFHVTQPTVPFAGTFNAQGM